MYRFIFPFTLAVVSLPAFAVQAFFTGGMEFVTTVTGQPAWRCEYLALGRKVYMLSRTAACPTVIEVE